VVDPKNNVQVVSDGMLVLYIHGAIGNSGNGNRKQKMEVENRNSQNLMQMNARVKPDNLLKTTSVQRPPLCEDHIIIMSQR